jgi:hypothetical protein
MGQLLALVIFLAAIAFWWHLAARQKRRSLLATTRRAPQRTFHCVEIRSGAVSCDAVKQLAGIRFLSDEAPTLPVSGCTSGKCTCGFVHFDDRRQQDRRNPYGQWSSIPPLLTGERRARRDRRKNQETTFRPSLAR